MDPLTLLLITTGFKSMEELAVKLGFTENTILQPMKYKDFKVNQKLLSTLGSTEGVMNIARILPKESRPTIGYGSTILYNGNGSLYNGGRVPNGISLSQLKIQMGYSKLSDIDFAIQLKTNHILFDSTMLNVRKIFNYFDSSSVPYNEDIAIACIDFAYNGGFGGLPFQNILNGTLLFKNDLKKISIVFAQSRFNYLSNLGSYGSLLGGTGNSFGWLRRVYFVSMRILNPALKYSDVENRIGRTRSSLKDAFFKDFGFVVR